MQDVNYFNSVYKEACELTAYLCKLYNLDPKGYVWHNGVKVPVILCHADSHNLGLGSNHGDVLHWFSKYNKTMNDVRNDVYNILKSDENSPIIEEKPVEKKEDEEVTQEQFNKMMDIWIAEQAKKEGSDWSRDARNWAEKEGLIAGDDEGKKMYRKLLTREELVTVLYRALHRYFM